MGILYTVPYKVRLAADAAIDSYFKGRRRDCDGLVALALRLSDAALDQGWFELMLRFAPRELPADPVIAGLWGGPESMKWREQLRSRQMSMPVPGDITSANMAPGGKKVAGGARNADPDGDSDNTKPTVSRNGGGYNTPQRGKHTMDQRDRTHQGGMGRKC